MTTTKPRTPTHPPPNGADAEDAAIRKAVSNIPILRAGVLAMDIKREPATMNHAERLIKILDNQEPDLEEIHQALLNQCHELTEQKHAHMSRKTLDDYVDRCLDAANACRRAIDRQNPEA